MSAATTDSLKGISLEAGVPDAGVCASLRIGIVRTQWNRTVVDALAVDGCKAELLRLGVKEENIVVEEVPGSYELPLGAKCLLEGGKVDAVVAVGVLIKGETMHFEYILEAVTQGISRLNLDYAKPVIFGVLACLTEEQARARAGLIAGKHNHGTEWAQSALKMAALTAKYIKR